MRQSWAVAFGAMLALTVVGCGSSGGQIGGTVTVGQGHGGLDVFVAIWQVPAALSDPSNPNSTLMANGTPAFLTSFDLGTVDANGGTFTYNFHSLDRGLYLVGAFLDTPFDQSPNLQADVHDIDETSLIEINPAVKDKSSAIKNLFLGLSEPDLGTISGTLHLSAQVMTLPVNILVLTSNPYTSNPQLLDQQQIDTQGGTTIPYQLFNMPLTPVYIMAWADSNQNGSIDFNEDIFAFALPNPVAVDATSHQASGVDLWLDTQAPNLGSVGGTIALSAALKSATVSVLAFSSDYSKNASADVVAAVNVTATNTDTIPFLLPSLPIGSVYLYAITQTPALSLQGQEVSGQTPYTAGTNANPAAVQIPMSQPMVTGLSFAVGVGRVSGSVQWTNAPSTVTDGWVAATQSVQGTVFIRQIAPVTITAGASSAPYELFGLLDGTFDMVFVPDISGSGQIGDNAMSSVSGSPATVMIMGGGPSQSSFSYTFK